MRRRRSGPDSPLTTGEVCRRLRVSPHTVKSWIAKGLLEAWLVPGSTHRRFERAELARFIAATGFDPEDRAPEGMPLVASLRKGLRTED